MKSIIEVKNLKKVYGSLEAVKNVSFEVKTGTCFGLLGPNGAGKSTTLECLEQVQLPTSGEILFQGRPFARSDLQKMGVQFQETALPPKLKVWEVLDFFHGLFPESTEVDELIELCRLDPFINQYHHKISGGQRQRLLLAVALGHNPDLVLLDEPTTGLDPQARRNLWDLVHGVKAKGKTILMTTHYMEEAFELCDEIAIMDHGQIIARGNPSDLLREHFGKVVLEVPFEDFDDSDEVTRNFLEKQERFQSLVKIETHSMDSSLREMSSLKINFDRIRIRESNLEDLFIHLTGKELRQ